MTGEVAGAVSTRVLTIPNALSAIRLLLVPVFFLLLVSREFGWALVTLIISSLTDYLDGYIARRFRQVTRLGQLLDPAADRLYVLAALLALAFAGVVPWWFSGVVIGRDILLIALGIVLANHGYGPLPVHHLGKVATFCLFYAVPMIVLGQVFPVIAAWSDPLGWAFAIWGAFLYWWAGLVYAIETARVVRLARSTESASARVDGQGGHR